jgi:hypothetical protein
VIFFQYDSVIHEDLQNKINIPEFDSEEIKYMEGPIEKIAIVVKQSFLENDLYSDGFIISNADIKCDELKKYFSENSLKELHEKKVNLSEIFDIKKVYDEDKILTTGIKKKQYKSDTVVGDFPKYIPNTDLKRIQEIWEPIQKDSNFEKITYELTKKLDGMSSTFALTDIKGSDLEFIYCSNKKQLKKPEKGLGQFQHIAQIYDIEKKLRRYFEKNEINLAIQCEIVGDGINGNIELVEGVRAYVFNIINLKNNKAFLPEEREKVLEELNQGLENEEKLEHIPVVKKNFTFLDCFSQEEINDARKKRENGEEVYLSINKIIEYSNKAKGLNGKNDGEGYVAKPNEKSKLQKGFKIISVKYHQLHNRHVGNSTYDRYLGIQEKQQNNINLSKS